MRGFTVASGLFYILYSIYFDCSCRGVDSVLPASYNFIVRPWVYHDESAIQDYFKTLHHKSFAFITQ